MKMVKTLTLALAATIILAAHATPSFADPKDNWIELYSASQNDVASVWDYIIHELAFITCVLQQTTAPKQIP